MLQHITDIVRILVVVIANVYFIYYLLSSLVGLSRLTKVSSWFTCCRCLKDGSLEMTYKFTYNGNDYATIVREKRADIPAHCSRRLVTVVKPLCNSIRWKYITDAEIVTTVLLSTLCAAVLLLEIFLLWT